MAEKNQDTLNIWNKVCTTDPKHTKTVNQRGGFTAISAQYQVMRATEQFGPVGDGWGYDVNYDYKQLPNDDVLIFANVTLWHGNRENKFGPVCACNPLLTKGRIDDDAPKKAMTDAITKGLSHLGFSADVFLGMYDDNKYIQAQTQKHKADDEAEHKTRANEIIQDIRDTRTLEALNGVKSTVKPEVDLMPSGIAALVKQAFAEQITNFDKAA